ncbi:Ig-like domain repeat protein, partial [Methanobrevibacter sp.]|uniref:Ig-like domain repeat protein n=1 Tax=Methanobrevibacter sp. TaxID=66852 RepID=UPI002E79A21A
GDKAVITVTLPSDATGSVSIVVNGKTYTAAINKGKATLDVSGLTKGTYTVTASYAGNDKYLSKSGSGSFNVKALDPSISLSKDTVKQGEDLVVQLPSDATGTVTATIGGKTITAPVNNGKAVISTKDIAPGKYSAKFAYSGDSKYNSKDLTVNVNIESKKVDPSIKLAKDTVKQGEDLVVQLPSDATGTVTAVIGGKTISAPVNNGKAVISTKDIAPGKYSAKLSYSGDSKYNSKDVTANVNVESADPVDYSIIVSAKDINVGDKAVITVTLPSDATGSVSIVVNGKTYTASVNKGRATLDVSGLAKGTYAVTASYAGDSKYVSKSNSTSFNVKGLDPSIGLAKDAVKQGEDLVITLPGDAKGNVTAVIGDKTVTVPVKDGKAVITTADIPVGQYDAKITYSGDDKYNAKDVSAKVLIVESFIHAPDVVKYFKGPERFVVSVIDTAGRPVSGAKVVISINGKPYEKTTDDEGKASVGLNLISGVYKVTSVYGDDEVNSTVTVKPTVVADNVVKMYRNGTQYYATFTDSNGKPLMNTKVNFNINGVFYERVTNESGVARMNINLNPDKYILTATNPVTGEMCSSNITVLPTIVENHDLTKYYKNDSCYTLKILDDQGNPAAGVTVKLNINGVFYERVTNESGYINFKINLIPGTYTVTAEYKGLKASNTVKVLPVLTAKDISMRYHDGTKFEAKLVDGQGKPFANQAITFNINGVFYNRNTDANGIARLNINLMAGEYIITSAYSPIGAALSNKITIRN